MAREKARCIKPLRILPARENAEKFKIKKREANTNKRFSHEIKKFDIQAVCEIRLL
ncbi:MAG: hypothetical protein AB1665_03260 [Candidatus Thermoplasmatota archaeon]